jgi:hypothetical protein
MFASDRKSMLQVRPRTSVAEAGFFVRLTAGLEGLLHPVRTHILSAPWGNDRHAQLVPEDCRRNHIRQYNIVDYYFLL